MLALTARGPRKFWSSREELATAPYPERDRRKIPAFDRILRGWIGAVHARNPLGPLDAARFADSVIACEANYAGLDDTALREAAAALRAGLLRHGFRADLVRAAFAVVREATSRHLGMRHRRVQIAGGYAMLHGSMIEMATGEGKTITALLPAITAALSGLPVHVITSNDYLADRDCRELRPVYEALGLSVAVMEHDLQPHQRRAVYRHDVVHVSNKEITFDYLRDRVSVPADVGPVRARLSRILTPLERRDGLSQLVMRGLHFAIVDEADNVLIDDARTPLILSRDMADEEEEELYRRTLEIGRAMTEGEDFTYSRRERHVRLTARGKRRAAAMVPARRGLLHITPAREHLVRQALMALHVFELDREYILRDGTVQIVDESTGRIMEDRTWQGGLHQLIEIKEGCPLSSNRETIARISYRKFFERYRRLAGMSGTLLEVAGELYADYDTRTVRIPTNSPLQRVEWPFRLFRSSEARWAAIADSAVDLSRRGRPVLVGTRSVEAADLLSGLLEARGVPHRVLSARQDAGEAEAVAEAGIAGRITIATNMAGRGTDIKPDAAALAAGGLHVILTEIHESLRVDRQLFGRSGRMGQPGTCQALVAIEDEIFERFVPRLARRVARLPVRADGTYPGLAARWLRRAAQNVAERHNAAVRRENAHVDEQLDRMLAVSGRGE